MRDPTDLTPKQHQVIAAMLAGARIGRAAKACGVTHRTVSRWMQDKEFTAELSKQRAHISNALLAQVTNYAAAAARTLRDMAKDAEKDSDKIRAAGILLSSALGATTLAEVMARHVAIGARLGTAEKDKKGEAPNKQ